MSVSCTRCGEAIAEGSRFCPACGAPVESPAGWERKLATIVFADLVGSTELVRGRDPEDVRSLLEPFFELSRSTLEAHGGRVEKYIGDAVMAVFGVPRAHGDDPDRAIAAALALAARLAEQRAGLEIRIGVETGEVLADLGGGDLAVTGEPAHAAARLQQAAEAGQVLVGARAAAACRRTALEPVGRVRAKGFDRPLEAWRALRATAPDPAPTPFLGRGGELESLRLAYLRAVRERTPRLALIVGEAGAGKTRLGRELLAAIAGSLPRPLILSGRNPPYGNGIAFWALAEILRSAAGAGTAASAEEVREALAERLAESGASGGEETARTLAATLAADGGDAGVVALRRSWRRLLSALAAASPVVLAVDDVQWADEGFLDLVEDAATLPGCPLMVVCTARPEIAEQRPDLGDAHNHERIELGPLSGDAAEELASTLVVGDDLELARKIAETSGGNPFFAEEIAHALGEAGGESLPDTVQAAIAARLDALPTDEKVVVQRASVLGDRFRLEPLREISETAPEAALAGLEARSLVESLDASEHGLYGFRHQLIREVAYSSLTRGERVRLHEQAAQSIRAGAGDRYAELSEVIAFHLARAAQTEPTPVRIEAAFGATRESGELALRRGAPARAQELLEQAASFASSNGERIESLSAAAEIALGRLRGDHTFRLLRQLAEAAEEHGDAPAAALFYARAAEVAARMPGISGHFDEATIVGLVERSRGLAPQPGSYLAAQLRLDDAWIAWRFRRGEPSAAAEALAMARGEGDVRLLSAALDAASASAWDQGRFDDSVAHSRERVERLERLGSRAGFVAFERSDALNMLSESLLYAGDLRQAVHWADANTEEMASNAPHLAGALALRPLYMLGEWDETIRRGTDLREAWVAEGRPPISYFSPNLACVAAIHGLRGDEAEQRDWLRLAEEAAAGSEQQLPAVFMLAAEVALHLGDLEHAIELLAPLDQRFGWRDLILAKRAEALALAGHPDARRTLEEVDQLGGADAHTVAVAARARGLLETDDALLATACERFQRLECIVELARTRWLRGGEHREAARQAFEGLRAIAPA